MEAHCLPITFPHCNILSDPFCRGAQSIFQSVCLSSVEKMKSCYCRMINQAYHMHTCGLEASWSVFFTQSQCGQYEAFIL